MPVARFYHSEPLHSGERVRLGSGPSNHITRVLRLETGAAITLFNGDGFDYAATIAGRGRQGVDVTVGEASINRCEPPARIVLLQGICRGQRMDLVVQKATELGVTGIHAVACERSVVRLQDERRRRRQEHWQAVAVSAAEQCGRASVPQVCIPGTLDAAIDAEVGTAPEPRGSRVLLDPRAERSLASVLEAGPPVFLLCGPEGGLTESEQAQAEHAGFLGARIGPRILRTETAPIAAIAIIQNLLGDLGDIRGQRHGQTG